MINFSHTSTLLFPTEELFTDGCKMFLVCVFTEKACNPSVPQLLNQTNIHIEGITDNNKGEYLSIRDISLTRGAGGLLLAEFHTSFR